MYTYISPSLYIYIYINLYIDIVIYKNIYIYTYIWLASDNLRVLVRIAPAQPDGVSLLAAAEQRTEVHAVVPCAASLRVGGHTVTSDSAVCGALRVVVQLRSLEVSGAGQALRLELQSCAVFVKHEDGSVSQWRLSAAPGTNAELRLYNGAIITQAPEVERFSSVLFPDDTLVLLAACETCQWQCLRYLVSGHALRPAHPLLLQVEREPESSEAWGEHRSVAVGCSSSWCSRLALPGTLRHIGRAARLPRACTCPCTCRRLRSWRRWTWRR